MWSRLDGFRPDQGSASVCQWKLKHILLYIINKANNLKKQTKQEKKKVKENQFNPGNNTENGK